MDDELFDFENGAGVGAGSHEMAVASTAAAVATETAAQGGNTAALAALQKAQLAQLAAMQSAPAAASALPLLPKRPLEVVPVTISRAEAEAVMEGRGGMGPGGRRTAFDLDIEAMDADSRGWNKQGADVSDYFNYGLNEATWRLYSKTQVAARKAALNLQSLGVHEQRNQQHEDPGVDHPPLRGPRGGGAYAAESSGWPVDGDGSGGGWGS